MPILRGVIRGNTIALDQPAGLPDGSPVNITLTLAAENGHSVGEGLRRAFGSWSADDEKGLDEFLAWTRSQRKLDRREPDA